MPDCAGICRPYDRPKRWKCPRSVGFERRPAIGIRMAPGESGVQVLGRVVARTITLAGIGVLIGGIGSFLASRLIASLLYRIEPTDPLTFAAMVAILLSAALAGFLPARKASRMDPLTALRVE